MAYRFEDGEHQARVELECIRRIKDERTRIDATHGRAPADAFQRGFGCGLLYGLLRSGRPDLVGADATQLLELVPDREFRNRALIAIRENQALLKRRNAS